MDDLDQRITEVVDKIEEVKSRWPFHSPKVSMVQELENLELELEELKKAKKIHSDSLKLTDKQ